MATDYGEKERAFIDGLKENSGRDLDEWMAAITEQNLPHRNDIIDWLRQQGFMFSKASWLERIHHNGGRPIYADTAAATPAAPRQRQDASKIVKPPIAPKPEPVPVASASVEARPDNDLDALLAKAKAYRPLAHFLIEQIKTVRPAARFEPRGTFIAIGDTDNFAALGVVAKQLRLHWSLAITRPTKSSKRACREAALKSRRTFPHGGSDRRAPS